MKLSTPEISWHGKEAIYSVDVQPNSGIIRLATAGLDANVRIWQFEKGTVKFLSNLSRHEKAVNVVRFSKSGVILASAGDDATVVLWKLSDKNEPISNIFDDEGKNLETWCSSKVLRGHLEDINDLSWSSDDNYIVTGSVDHTAILWDVEKGQKLVIWNDAKHFVNGVCWDPLGVYVTAMSCDRSTRIYNIQSRKMVHSINKINQPYEAKEEKGASQKMQRIFHDETVVRRKLSFSIDGKMLLTPASCIVEEGSNQQINTVMIFSRSNLSKPVAYLPGLSEPANIVACCPVLFKKKQNSSENIDYFQLNYRCVFAVASSTTVLLYDSQHLCPFALISNIHYAAITDLSWSMDASLLVISSRDGFCSILQFEPNELGEVYTHPHIVVTSSSNAVAESAKLENKNMQKDNLNETPVNDPPCNVTNSLTPRRITTIHTTPVPCKEDTMLKPNKDIIKPRRVPLTTVTQ